MVKVYGQLLIWIRQNNDVHHHLLTQKPQQQQQQQPKNIYWQLKKHIYFKQRSLIN